MKNVESDTDVSGSVSYDVCVYGNKLFIKNYFENEKKLWFSDNCLQWLSILSYYFFSKPLVWFYKVWNKTSVISI